MGEVYFNLLQSSIRGKEQNGGGRVKHSSHYFLCGLWFLNLWFFWDFRVSGTLFPRERWFFAGEFFC